MNPTLWFVLMTLACPAAGGLLVLAWWFARRRWPRRCPRCRSTRTRFVACYESDLWECRDCGHEFCTPERSR